MRIRRFNTIGKFVMMTLLMSLAGQHALAGDKKPLTPEAAAKRANYDKQHEQRITPEKRKAAIEALKAERLRLHKAKEAVKRLQPASIDKKL